MRLAHQIHWIVMLTAPLTLWTLTPMQMALLMRSKAMLIPMQTASRTTLILIQTTMAFLMPLKLRSAVWTQMVMALTISMMSIRPEAAMLMVMVLMTL